MRGVHNRWTVAIPGSEPSPHLWTRSNRTVSALEVCNWSIPRFWKSDPAQTRGRVSYPYLGLIEVGGPEVGHRVAFWGSSGSFWD